MIWQEPDIGGMIMEHTADAHFIALAKPWGGEWVLQLPRWQPVHIGGLVIEKLRRIPALGDNVDIGPLELRVDEMSGPRLVALSARRTGA